MCHQPSSRRRAGFTLVEALVVTAILAILFGMTTSAVMRALQTAEDAQAPAEIKQLEMAIAACKQHFGVSYLPSSIVLRNNNFYDLTNPLEKRSKEFLSQMFPRMKFAAAMNVPADPQGFRWHPSNASPQAAFLLGPAETLVFFLGGPNGVDGWSPNPTNPVNGPGTRIAPFFEFKSERLTVINHPSQPPYAQPFAALTDPYKKGQPYLYFTSYKSGNDYSELDLYRSQQGDIRAFVDTLTFNAATGTFKFINPNSFQIVSAGRDGFFGTFRLGTSPLPIGNFIRWNNGTFSTQWDTTTPTLKNAPMDNVANFHPAKLGIPQ